MKLDTNFAESLGAALGGCLRDQLRFTTRESARAAGYSLPLFDFLSPARIRSFKLMWIAMMQGLALWTVLQENADIAKNDKVLRKIMFQMQSTAETSLADSVFNGITDAQRKNYQQVLRHFLTLAQDPTSTDTDFAEEIIKVLHGDKADKVAKRHHNETLRQMKLIRGVYQRLYLLTLKYPNSSARA